VAGGPCTRLLLIQLRFRKGTVKLYYNNLVHLCKHSTESKGKASHNFHKNNHQKQSPHVNQVTKTKLTNRTQTSNTGETKRLRITHYGVTTSPQALSPRRNSGWPAGKPAAAPTSFQIVERRALTLNRLFGTDLQYETSFTKS
jgi:hypothetical protein